MLLSLHLPGSLWLQFAEQTERSELSNPFQEEEGEEQEKGEEEGGGKEMHYLGHFFWDCLFFIGLLNLISLS